MTQQPTVTKETKNRIVVDYEGKLSVKERWMKRLKASNTWIKAVVNVFRFVLMLGVSYVILSPFFSKIAKSFMSSADVFDPTVSLIPKNFTLDTYKYLILENNYAGCFFNTLLLSLICAILQTFVACMIGYGLAKFKFKGNTAVMLAVVVSMVIPHATMKLSMSMHFGSFDLLKVMSWDYPGLIELLKMPLIGICNLFGWDTSKLVGDICLTDTFAPLIILSMCGLAFKNGLYIYMMRQFFKGVPDELEESAYVDGSGVFRTFFQIILPLSIPMMITIFLFAFSWQWTDEFYTTLFFVSNIDKTPLMPDFYKTVNLIPSLSLGNHAGKAIYISVVRNTAGLLIILPLVIIYLFCQKYIVQGIERSGLVG